MHLLNTPCYSAFYEKGAVRWIKVGQTEILRMVYSAVRDSNWGTVESEVIKESIHQYKTGFHVDIWCKYIEGPIHFEAQYTIIGEGNTLSIEFKGTAQSDFLKNRIGFCILHPIRECAGKTATVVHNEGNLSQFTFPEIISPHQPVKNIRSIIWEPAQGITARVNMTGDVFEMEDQRNWTDASYKTYCTPLELPFPAQIKAGESIHQIIELTVEATGFGAQDASDLTFSWNPTTCYPLPLLGTAVSSRKDQLTDKEADILAKLPLHHLRVEIKMYESDATFAMDKAVCESEQLEWPLFIVLYLSENYQQEYHRFSIISKGLNATIGWLLPIGPNNLPLPVFDEICPQIKEDFPGTMVGTGVNAYFAELNRTRPSVEKADFVSFTISPQVHAFDNASLIENLEAQAEVIRSAKALFPQKPIYISPVSLRQRFNVVATAQEPSPLPGQLPSSVDIRQRTSFAALWTLGSLKYLSQAGAQLITYYETVGWKGWIQGEQPPSEPTLFKAQANEIFPVYHTLKSLAGYSIFIVSTSSNPLLFDGLIVSNGNETKLFLFNFTHETIEVLLKPSVSPKKIVSLTYSDNPDFSNGMCILRAEDLVEITF